MLLSLWLLLNLHLSSEKQQLDSRQWAAEYIVEKRSAEYFPLEMVGDQRENLPASQ